MKPELDQALVEDFPILYGGRYKGMLETAMCWGFECDDGWEKIIRELSEKLEFLNKLEVVRVEAVQVKEKFGTLRFYTSIETKADGRWADIVWDLTDLAEIRTAWTCERCGKDGKTRDEGGWLRTLCDACETGRQVPE